LVAIVIAPFFPACATISDSRRTFSGFAFKIWYDNLYSFNNWANISDFSTVVVPIKTGCPVGEI
jgi:hypothetical protein